MNNRILELISRRERQILVHSYIYYEMNKSIISDYQWSIWAKELAEIIKDNPEEFKSSPYYRQFEKFDPSTGFDIYKGAEDWARFRAEYLLKNRK